MPISQAGLTFQESIKDAEHLLSHFDSLNTLPPPPANEVLKRAGLVMAMTAWETYVEDRVQEAVSAMLVACADPAIIALVQRKVDEEIKKLHNPTAEKTIQLFKDYAAIDVAAAWSWNNVDPKKARERLNGYLQLRGDVVHRSRALSKGSTPAHPVTRDQLQKAIFFLKELVKATEVGLSAAPPASA